MPKPRFGLAQDLPEWALKLVSDGDGDFRLVAVDPKEGDSDLDESLVRITPTEVIVNHDACKRMELKVRVPGYTGPLHDPEAGR